MTEWMFLWLFAVIYSEMIPILIGLLHRLSKVTGQLTADFRAND